MAMKFINYALTYSLKTALLCFAAGLVGCATSDAKLKIVTDASVQAEMVATLQYIPVQAKDADGVAAPYEPRENPYLSQRSRVDKDSLINFIEARRAYKAGQYDQAKRVLSALTVQNKGLSGPWVLLGDIAIEADDHQQALAYYAKAVEINLLNINAYLRLAKAQRLRGHFLHAQNTYAKVLSIWPDFPEAHLNLAILYDVYLNHPLRAQKHMEAYQFLTGSANKEVAAWLSEIQQRTGVAPSFQEIAVNSGS
jgi:tetratricopeptide (TPR) repeat protein